MTAADFHPSRLEYLAKLVDEALRLADDLNLPEVGVRLEQARLLLLRSAG